MKVLISAGGTGGHIYPALAIMNKIKEMEPDSKFLYIGTTNRMESTMIPNMNIPYVGIEIQGLNRKNPFKNIETIKKLNIAKKRVKEELNKFHPDIVLGIGGYVTFPVISTAKKMGYKTFIHEQNSIPGLSNRYLSKYADSIGVSLPGSMKYFPKKKTFISGNPRSEEAIKEKPLSKTEYKLDEHKKLVVIVMGSLGSLTMNNKFKEILTKFNNKEYEVLFVTGKDYYEEYSKIELANNVHIVPYIDKMLGLMKNTDLIVSRAGASIISEITAIELPSILIPSPYVTHNHQYLNAKELEDNNASFIIEEKDLTSDILINKIDEILNNKELYDKMKKGASKLKIEDSATRIYNKIKTLIDGE